MAKKKPKFVGVYQFESKEDFGGDELGVYLEIAGKKVEEWGDYYHDKGSEKLQGFVAGYCFALNIKPIPNIKWIERADYNG